MARVCQHVFTEPDPRCKICGTSAAGAGRGLGCIWRDTPDDRARDIAPEPARRLFASEDFDTIGARMAELDKERAAIRNTPAEPELAQLFPDDMGDCCL